MKEEFPVLPRRRLRISCLRRFAGRRAMRAVGAVSATPHPPYGRAILAQGGGGWDSGTERPEMPVTAAFNRSHGPGTRRDVLGLGRPMREGGAWLVGQLAQLALPRHPAAGPGGAGDFMPGWRSWRRWIPFFPPFNPFSNGSGSEKRRDFRRLAHRSRKTPFKNGENGENGPAEPTCPCAPAVVSSVSRALLPALATSCRRSSEKIARNGRCV
jgi:hypothetical protein